MIDKLAEVITETFEWLQNNGIHPVDAMLTASAVDVDGNIVNEKIANEATAMYTEEDFDKIAEAVEYLGRFGLLPTDVIKIIGV